MIKLRINRQLFKSIQWKLVLLYLLLVIFIMSIVSVFLLNQVENMYYDNFKRSVENGLDATNFSSGKVDVQDFDELKNVVQVYSGIFLIDGLVRNIYILDSFGMVLYGSDSEMNTKQFTSPNVTRAILSERGDVINESQKMLDYAQSVQVKGEKKNKYIIYITDNKYDLEESLSKIKGAIIISITLALLFAAIIGFIFARTITTPIKNLAEKVRKIAQGDFEQKIKVMSDDEIGQLTNDFNFMALELKNTLNQISNEKSKVETILLHMTDGVMAFDINGDVIHINPAAKKILKRQIENKKFKDIFDELGVEIKIEDFIYLKEDYIKEKTIQIDNTYVKLYFVSFVNEKGEVGGVVAVLQDITEQHRLDNMRREFVANVSHELRTPLTTIKSYVETLQDGAIEDKQTAFDFLDIINVEADRMTRLVKDLLQLSSLEHKSSNISINKVSLDQLIKKVIKKLSLNIKNKNQEIEYYMTGSVPQFVNIDSDKIEQVLLNIVGNSNKYTCKGGKISIYHGVMFDRVYVKVIDNGMGIPAKDLERVFERFYRVDKARTRETGGTGLGLAIAKEIIEAHDGSISISSNVNEGTEVLISLPIQNNI